MGILLETDVLGLDGDIIGYATKRSPFPSNFGELVVELDPERYASQDATYGLADSAGFVFPAAFSGVGEHNLLQESERIGGDNNSIGQLVWKPKAGDHFIRVLVLGGNQRHRDELLRWYADIDEFEYEKCAAQVVSKISNIEDLIRKNGQFSAKRSFDLHGSHSKLSKLSKSFKIISSIPNKDHGLDLAEMRNDEIHHQFSRMDGLSKSLNDQSKSLSSPNSEKHAVSRIIESLNKHVTWPLLEEDAALCLLYCGATTSSPLGQYGRASHFIETYSSRVRTEHPENDSSKYFTGEVLVSKGVGANTHQIKLAHSVIFINAPDLCDDKFGQKVCGREIWESIGHRIPAILAACRQVDKSQSGTVGRSKFIELVEEVCSFSQESEALKLLELLFVDDAGRVSYVGLQSLCQDARESPYDMTAAIDFMAEISDVIIFLVDGNLSRYNDVESENLRRLYGMFHTKLHVHCFDNREFKSDLGSRMSEVLQNCPSAKSVSASSTPSAALEFLNGVVNDQQVRLLSLSAALSYDVENIVKRLDYLYARADFGSDADDLVHSSMDSIVDAHAVAAANAALVEACRRAKRLLGATRGQPLLEHLAAALKAAKRTAADMLAHCGCAALTLSERCESWSAAAAHREAVLRAVHGLDVGLWLTEAHVDCWLRAIGAGAETRRALRKERVRDVFALMALESPTMARVGVPLRDRVRVMRGLERVRRRFQELRAEHARGGLWCLVGPDADGPGPGSGRAGAALEAARRFLLRESERPAHGEGRVPAGAQGAGEPVAVAPFVGDLKPGDKVMVEVAGYGRVLAAIPGRADTERSGSEPRPEDPGGGGVSAEGLGLLYGVLDGAGEDGARSRRRLEDGIDLFVTGDLPPLVVLEMASELLLELGHAAPQAGRAAADRRVYGRRWALEAMAAAERAPDSDSDGEEGGGDGAAAVSLEEAREGALRALDEVFDAAAEGRVLADGSRLEAAVYRDRSLMGLLRRLGVRFLPGRVAVLRESDVLRREFVDGVLGVPGLE